MSNNSKYVLEMKTVQIAPVRTLMTALKDILLETNIIFNQEYTDSSGKVIPAGIRVINMDKSHTILAHLFLDALKAIGRFLLFFTLEINVFMSQFNQKET